ncbi:MAG: hypothetical protein OEZ36_01310 [Spirochaetota bacterium]|nr:hypothetical protein [Spirochaetota bacterium]
MNKNITLIAVISVLLITGLYINFILQKDFLTQLGFDGLLAIICIIFFDASKIISEILFFKMKTAFSRVVIGIFAFLLIFLSVYTTFSVRTWKSELTSQEIESVNLNLKAKNDRVKEARKRLNNQLDSLEEQIKTKREMILALNKDEKSKNGNKWLAYHYNKDMNRLNQQKVALLKKIEDVDKRKIVRSDTPVSMHKAITNRLGAKGENMEMVINLVIALVTDGIILFLCYGLSFLLVQQEQNRRTEERVPAIDLTNFHLKSVNQPKTHYDLDEDNSFKLNEEDNIMFYEDSELRLKK